MTNEQQYIHDRITELKTLVAEGLEQNRIDVTERSQRLIESFLENTISGYKAMNEPAYFDNKELDKIDNGWGAVGEKLGHDNKAAWKRENQPFEGIEWDWSPKKDQKAWYWNNEGRLQQYVGQKTWRDTLGRSFPTKEMAERWKAEMDSDLISHDNISGHEMVKPESASWYAPFTEGLYGKPQGSPAGWQKYPVEGLKPRDWSQATLKDVPVDWMPEDAVIYWGVDLELKKGTKPLVFGYDADVNLNTHRLFPTAALAQQYLSSLVKPVERWKPEVGATYWVVIGNGVPQSTSWINSKLDGQYFEMGNCFQTIEEALAAIDRVKKALRGE